MLDLSCVLINNLNLIKEVDNQALHIHWMCHEHYVPLKEFSLTGKTRCM